MIHKVHNAKGEEVGFWDDSEKPRTYHTERDYHKRQIFIHPKYNNAVGLDVRIIEKYLKPNNILVLDFLIIGFAKKSFHAVLSLKTFLEKGKEINFDKEKKFGWSKQIIVPLDEFVKVDYEQKRLEHNI